MDFYFRAQRISYRCYWLRFVPWVGPYSLECPKCEKLYSFINHYRNLRMDFCMCIELQLKSEYGLHSSTTILRSAKRTLELVRNLPTVRVNRCIIIFAEYNTHFQSTSIVAYTIWRRYSTNWAHPQTSELVERTWKLIVGRRRASSWIPERTW